MPPASHNPEIASGAPAVGSVAAPCTGPARHGIARFVCRHEVALVGAIAVLALVLGVLHGHDFVNGGVDGGPILHPVPPRLTWIGSLHPPGYAASFQLFSAIGGATGGSMAAVTYGSSVLAAPLLVLLVASTTRDLVGPGRSVPAALLMAWSPDLLRPFKQYPVTTLAAALLFCGCPTVAPLEPQATPVEPLPVDAWESEPNDEAADPLGVIALPFAVGGTSGGCGSEGSWDGADTDLISFAIAEPAIVRLDLQADGADLDMAVYDPDGHVLATLASPDAFGESVDISIGPGATYTVEIRCWLGDDDASWRLVLADVD